MSKSKALTITKRNLPSAALRASVRKFALKSRAENTIVNYRSSWQAFESWCKDSGAVSLPASPDMVIGYLANMAEAGYKASTIGRHLAAIAAAHTTAKLPDPTKDNNVKMVMMGIRRELGTLPDKQSPITDDELRKLIAVTGDGLLGARDRALLLVGFGGAFRRSELVAVDVADIRLNPALSKAEGGELKVTLRRSKTDQEGAGMVKVIPSLTDKTLCPVTALRNWLDVADITSGAIFRRVDKWGNLRAERLAPQAVAIIVKRYARLAGLDWRKMSGHSLRSGFITSAARVGVNDGDIMSMTGHKDTRTMRGYIQDAGLGAKRAALAAFGEATK